MEQQRWLAERFEDSSGSPGPCPTPARSATTWPPAASSCRWASRSTTRPTRWARCSSTSWATFAEFEVDLLQMRTREGIAVARAKGKLRGKQTKLSARQQRELARMAGTGEYTIADLAEVFTVSRATVYRTLQRTQVAAKAR